MKATNDAPFLILTYYAPSCVAQPIQLKNVGTAFSKMMQSPQVQQSLIKNVLPTLVDGLDGKATPMAGTQTIGQSVAKNIMQSSPQGQTSNVLGVQ